MEPSDLSSVESAAPITPCILTVAMEPLRKSELGTSPATRPRSSSTPLARVVTFAIKPIAAFCVPTSSNAERNVSIILQQLCKVRAMQRIESHCKMSSLKDLVDVPKD